MANVNLNDVETKTTVDLIESTCDALNLKNSYKVRDLVRELNLGDSPNDLVRLIVLEFLEQSKKGCINGYKVSLINFLTLYPDYIFHSNDTASLTLKAKLSSNLLKLVRCSNIRFKKREINQNNPQELKL